MANHSTHQPPTAPDESQQLTTAAAKIAAAFINFGNLVRRSPECEDLRQSGNAINKAVQSRLATIAGIENGHSSTGQSLDGKTPRLQVLAHQFLLETGLSLLDHPSQILDKVIECVEGEVKCAKSRVESSPEIEKDLKGLNGKISHFLDQKEAECFLKAAREHFDLYNGLAQLQGDCVQGLAPHREGQWSAAEKDYAAKLIYAVVRNKPDPWQEYYEPIIRQACRD